MTFQVFHDLYEPWFNVNVTYASSKWKQIKVHYSHYIKSPLSSLFFSNENILYISRHNEEPSQHVRSDPVFASQNLKFADDRR